MPPELVIRALGPQDAARLQAFVRALSPQTRRERYFSAIQELTPRELERMTRPVAAADMVLAAFDGEGVVGVAECSGGEFALVVADAWQGSGLGRSLMERLLEQARKRKLPALHGIVRKGNRAMLRLARSLGFRAARASDPDLVQMELELAGG
jgi:acetyltransferase